MKIQITAMILLSYNVHIYLGAALGYPVIESWFAFKH